MAIGRGETALGPTSLAEEARLTGEFANWSNLIHGSAWLTGPLDVAAVRHAWRRVCMRHDALRRSYVSPNEAHTHSEVLSEVELHSAASDEEAVDLLRRILGVPFDLKGQGLARVVIVQRDERRHLFGIALDHVITDEISWGQMAADFGEVYRSSIDGRIVELPEASTYQNFASLQRREFAGAWGEHRREFWRSYTDEFGTFPPDLTLRTTPNVAPSYQVLEHNLPTNVQAMVKEFARRARATPFTVLTAGVLAAMRELSDDPGVGLMTENFGRTLPGTSRTVGLFVQGVPLHLTRQTADPLNIVEEVFLRSLDVFEHSIPLRVAGNHWNENFVSPDGKLGVHFQLNDGRAVRKVPAFAGTQSDQIMLNLPAGQPETPDTLLINGHLGERPRFVATYNENAYSGAVVKQMLQFAAKFVSSGAY